MSSSPLPTSSQAPTRAPSRRRRTTTYTIPILSTYFPFLRCTIPTNYTVRAASMLSVVADGIVFVLGPILICLASAIISGLSYSFFWVMLPMLAPGGMLTPIGLFHTTLVVFFLTNVIYNYALCVVTRNGGKRYERVVRELADATGFNYPETREEVADCKLDYEQKIMERSRVRRLNGLRPPSSPPPASASQVSSSGAVVPAGGSTGGSGGEAQSSSSATTSPPAAATSASSNQTSQQPRVFRWMLMGPQEWGFCTYTNQPKPPRSHYCHVTKTLVLNMDHYCPWMFNTVGYFNYRYFCNFLFYVFIGMFYGVLITLQPFNNISGTVYREHVRMNKEKGHTRYEDYEHLLPNVPTPDEKTPVAFSFMLCLSVGIAVLCLLGFHFYLILTAQTTVEFHGNCASKRRARKRGTSWVNPYDLGWKRNWQQVYGSKHPLLAILPSSQEPEFLPLPIAGELGRRHPKSKESISAPVSQNGRQRQTDALLV